MFLKEKSASHQRDQCADVHVSICCFTFTSDDTHQKMATDCAYREYLPLSKSIVIPGCWKYSVQWRHFTGEQLASGAPRDRNFQNGNPLLIRQLQTLSLALSAGSDGAIAVYITHVAKKQLGTKKSCYLREETNLPCSCSACRDLRGGMSIRKDEGNP